MTFNPIPRSAISSWSEKIDPLLQQMVARSRGRFHVEHLWEELAAGRLWLAEIADWKAAIVLKPSNWPTGLNELEVVGLAGTGMDEWKDTMFAAEKLARDLRFDRLCTGEDRPGWERVAKPYGWKRAGVVLQKDLLNG